MKKHLSVVSMLVVVMLLVSSFATVAFADKCDNDHDNWSKWVPATAVLHSRFCLTCAEESAATLKYGECDFQGGVCSICGNKKEGSGNEEEKSSDAEVCEHEYEKKTVKATCTEGGYTKYTCTKCGDSYKKNETEKLYHWFGEWTPNGNGGHTATCKRDDCGQSTNIGCETFEYALNDTAFTVCPVCGEVENGTRLESVEEAAATSEKLPKGELVLRENDEIMSVGFEYAGRLTQPTKEVTVTLPAADVDGYTLSILNADGTETALETTADGENVSFTIDFGEAKVVLIHMTAAA